MAELMTREAVLLNEMQCRCGSTARAGFQVRLWATMGTWDYGVECIACPVCTPPDPLIAREAWLVARRQAMKAVRFSAVYGHGSTGAMWPEFDAAWDQNSQDLRLTRELQRKTLLSMYDKLPKCKDCGEIATHHVGDEYMCARLSQEHPQAEEVPWAKEISALGSRP